MPALPSIPRLNQRLAARFHQRQTATLARSQRIAVRAASRYTAIPGAIARLAAEVGLAGLDKIRQALDAALEAARQSLADDLVQAGLAGHASAADAVLAALPADWLPIFAGMAAARVSEAATAAQPEPDPWEVSYDWEPIAQRDVNRDEAMQMIRGLLMPAPTEAQAREWLTQAIPGGIDWDTRLRRWEAPARAAMLNELSIGLAAEENVDKLRARIRPFADGIAWKAQRIARTEANRVTERASRACFEGMGDLLDGMQIVAVIDEWTRPHHAARNGRIYRRTAEGQYRDDAGDPLPDLPDEPNCRCMAIPVLSMPEEFKRDPALRAVFETAAGNLIPDPSSYTDWWERAGERERMTAVGMKRYQAVRGRLGREPEWVDFIDAEGKLLPIDKLTSETPAARDERRIEVQTILDARKRMFTAVASRGYPLGTRHARPEAIASIPMLRGGVPHQQIHDALEMGAPRRIVIPQGNRREVDDRLRGLLGQPLSDNEIARLAGALDGADLELHLESGGLKMEMHRGGVRAVRWIGYDDAGVLKLELIRMDVPPDQQRQGLATRSLARSIQQASSLGIQYADATASRHQGMNGYYSLARLGFDAPLPRPWLRVHQADLSRLGLSPRRLSHLMESEEGRKLWRVHGETINVMMDLREGSDDMFRMARYLDERRRGGRAMAEAQEPNKPVYPIYDDQHGLCITEEDEAILDKVWAEHPVTPEENRRKEEFYRRIRPGTRQKRPDGKD